MKKLLFFPFLFYAFLLNAESYYKYNNTFNVTRSSNTAFTSLIIFAPCPQTNEYQDVYELDTQSIGAWNQGSISENQNGYLELVMDNSQLTGCSQNFSVGFSFIHSPKTINIDFTVLKNSDGSWKDMPEYNTTTIDYQSNCKKSGNIVDPDNASIQAISNQLYEECNRNRLAYAESCYNYVASHYRYLNPNTGLHSLAELLSAGGGDCGNLSSIYISLLRAKGIPARHVVAIGANNNFHVWAEFYIQDFGWVPVDVTYKNSNPNGNYFGKYDYNLVVVQKGVTMDYPVTQLGIVTIDLLQTYCWWYWYNSYATMSINQVVTRSKIEYNSIENIEKTSANQESARKVLIDGKLYIKERGKYYSLSGMRL
ncbi:MAG: transglutaminase domain-containing protein [Prevotella sp.]|nr:transglutaminase domain-containing protein [Prevotella sp.]